MNIVKHYSPNFSERPAGQTPDLILLHADAGKSDTGTLKYLTTHHANPKENKSYHYLIFRDGTVNQLVPDHKKAWHAGVSTFDGRAFCNDYSIVVSFCNDQMREPFTAAQVTAGVPLVASLCPKYNIPLHRDYKPCHPLHRKLPLRPPGAFIPIKVIICFL